MEQQVHNNQNIEQNIDVAKIIKIVLSRWYWIAATTVIALLLAYIYLWYTPETYSTAASLKFEEKRSEISELLNVRNVYDRNNKIQSEQFVIRSRDVLYNAVSQLDYKISYFLKGKIKMRDIYPQKPVAINIIEQDKAVFYSDFIEYEALSPRTFKLSYKIDGKEQAKTYYNNALIKLPGITFTITNNTYTKSDNPTYCFKFNSPTSFTGRVNAGLQMSETKGSNILALTQQDVNPYFAADVLNALIKQYVSYDREQKTVSATQTIKFIDTLLLSMSKMVRNAGAELERFKVERKVVDISAAGQQIMTELGEIKTQKSNLALQASFIDQLEKEVVSNKNVNAINLNLQGITDPMFGSLLAQYNELLAKREEALLSFKPTAETVQNLDRQILQLKAAFVANANSQRLKNNKTIQHLNLQEDRINQTFNAIPKSEKDLINLQANFNINQKVYSYLSEKKLEAQITKAAVTPSSSIVDQALYNTTPIGPNHKKTYANALILGILAGVGLIFLVRALNPYIYDKETIESITKVPIIGIIKKNHDQAAEDDGKILAIKNPKSLFSESVRSVRTNLSFLAADKKNKVVCITSEISGEGKSFTAINLASTLSLIDKKVIIIAADLRRSKLHRNFKTSNLKGLSSYLSNQAPLSDIVFETEIENLKFIPAGPVPPNPSELLHSDTMQNLLNQLSQTYDFVIVDSAPVGLVSDAIPVLRMADINLFIIRSGVSRLQAATIPERLSNEFNLANMAIILNAFDNDLLHSRYYSSNYNNAGYNNYYYAEYGNSGYGSGYYSDEPKAKWWQVWKKK